MKIALGSDHGGFELKNLVKAHLEARGFTCEDCGSFNTERVDYPVYGEKAARMVASGACELGIVVCGTGCGIALSANRVKGIRCCNCSEPFTAQLSRRHNNCNMLALGGRVVGSELALMIVDNFIDATFEGGRHADRVNLIEAIDRN
ncbi:MAG: ribose 5-phosphate isomerase B [Clostridia bacterium]